MELIEITYQEAKESIKTRLQSMSRDFIAIGYYLKYIRDQELYREEGFKSIWEFAEHTYGIKTSTASRWMSMNDKFSQGGNTPLLDQEYAGFGKSQLQEMLYLTDDQMEKAKPDMTAKEIREIRKPEKPEIELKKPDSRDREYLDAAARKLIDAWHVWFLQDFGNRVMMVNRSPEEIKKKIRNSARTWWFSAGEGTAHINLFDDYVQVWNEKNDCIGDFDWFYLAAAIQSMWNVVAIENAQKNVAAQSIQEEEEQLPGQMEIQDYPELLPESNPEVVAPSQQVKQLQEAVEETEKYEEKSEKTDMEILEEELEKAKRYLDLARKEFTEEDVRIRRQKLLVEALAGMIAELDHGIQEPIQPELPKFKNNEQRKEWLRNYRDWGLWYEDKNIGAKYYKYDFDNGARLIAEVYNAEERGWMWKQEDESYYLHLVGGPEPKKKDYIPKWSRHEKYTKYPNSETELVEFLKEIQKEKRPV